MDTTPAGLLTGRTVIVTGSSRGIGRAVADAVARAGGVVVVNGRDGEVATGAANEIVAAGGQAIAVAGSAADPEIADALAAAALDATGRIDGLVTCTGIVEPAGSSIRSMTSVDWHTVLDSHVTATFEVCRAVVPHMVERGRGAIVTSSSHAFTGMYGGTAYAAGKGAVNSLSYAMAAELREAGIRVNVVCPGARTRISTGTEYEAKIADLHRRGLLDDMTRDASLAPAPPQYAAAMYLYLLSDLAEGITGEVFAAAGGFVGHFARPETGVLQWRDHASAPPWTPHELDAVIRRALGRD